MAAGLYHLQSFLSLRVPKCVTCVVPRLCQSAVIRRAIRESILHRSLRADTFDKISVQSSLEWAYEQAFEMFAATRPDGFLTTSKSPPLPHIIGSSQRAIKASTLPAMVDHAVKLLKRWIGLRDAAPASPLFSLQVDSDSDDAAVGNVQESVLAISQRLRASLPMSEIRDRGICHIVFVDAPAAIDFCRAAGHGGGGNVVSEGQWGNACGTTIILTTVEPIGLIMPAGDAKDSQSGLSVEHDCEALKV